MYFATSMAIISLFCCATDRTFDLYQAALHDKQEGRFQYAELKLKECLEILDQNRDTYQYRDKVRRVRDELFYHLPLAKARYYLETHDMKGLEKTLKSIDPYLQGHPKRFEYASEVDQYYTSLHALKRSIEFNAKSYIRMIETVLANQYMVDGSYPKDELEVKELISRYLTDDLTLKSYRLKDEGYEAVFWDRKLEMLFHLPSRDRGRP
jgi:hypothetical protein